MGGMGEREGDREGGKKREDWTGLIIFSLAGAYVLDIISYTIVTIGADLCDALYVMSFHIHVSIRVLPIHLLLSLSGPQ